MDREQPQKATKRNLKSALAELTRQGILTKKSKFLDEDRILLERSEKAFPQVEENSKKL